MVADRLLTPVGLRSLAPGHPDYKAKYWGDLRARDAAYHQGTVWVWWIGLFVEAWLRVYGERPEVKAEVRKRFFEPLIKQLDPLGQNHYPEIADGEAPHQARGCPFQAWSLGEVMRVEKLLQE